MIGFQCPPQQQQQQQQRPTSETSQQQQQQTMNKTIANGGRASPVRDQHLPQLSQHCQMGLARATASIQATPARPISSGSSSASSPSPTHTGHHHHQHNHQHDHQQHQHHAHLHSHSQSHGSNRQLARKTSGRRASSPDYHSAASSPGSSSIASPVSSSGVSSAGSSCNRPMASPPQTSPTAETAHLAPTPTLTTSTPITPTSAAHNQTIVSCTTAIVSHQQQQQQQHQPHHKQEPVQGGQRAPLASASATTNLLDHFPEIRQDGLKLSWFHGANNRQALEGALTSRKLIVAGDISLAEMSRYPVPIMARPPLGVSDLTLETWLTDVIAARKGIKLTFTSTRTVEPAFRVLARHAQNLKGPLILSADILARPVAGGGGAHRASAKQPPGQQQQDQQPVDAWTFLMLCRTRFPRSIISIGWCPASGHAHTGGPDCSSVQQADSSSSITAGSDSMFELDMMVDQQQQQQQQQQHSHHGHHQHRFSQPILHLSSAPAAGHHQPRLNSLNVVQQLAAVAAAAANNNNINNTGMQHPHQHANGAHPRHHLVVSSSGSLNSSSGNSSGSPSPTSPIGHLMSPAHHHHHHHQNLHNHHNHNLVSQHRATSAEQLILAAAAASDQRKHQLQIQLQSPAGSRHPAQSHSSQVVGWPAMAAAAAAMVAASNLRQSPRGELEEGEEEEEDAGDQEEEEEDQLPLNLNINEADPQHARTGSSALSELAQKIQSLQQKSSNLNSLTSSLSKAGAHPTLALANKLFQANEPAAGRWEHISKKAALAHRFNADSPSPVSTSPKQQQQQQMGSSNLLCVKPPCGNHNQLHHHQHHNSLANLALMNQGGPMARPTHQPACHRAKPAPMLPATTTTTTTTAPTAARDATAGLGYTRDMIDKMAGLVKEYNLTQAITFPVEARLVLRQNSLAELQRLLYQVGTHASLTIVAQQEDLISVEELLVIRKHFGLQQLLFDLPDELAAALRRELDR